jgi:hypothetical protein
MEDLKRQVVAQRTIKIGHMEQFRELEYDYKTSKERVKENQLELKELMDELKDDVEGVCAYSTDAKAKMTQIDLLVREAEVDKLSEDLLQAKNRQLELYPKNNALFTESSSRLTALLVQLEEANEPEGKAQILVFILETQQTYAERQQEYIDGIKQLLDTLTALKEAQMLSVDKLVKFKNTLAGFKAFHFTRVGKLSEIRTTQTQVGK